MATKYTLFILSGNETVSSKEMTYAKAKAKAIDQRDSHSLSGILEGVILGLNQEVLSDQNWYVLCDNETKKVLIWR